MSPPRLTATRSAPTAAGSQRRLVARSACWPYVKTCSCSSSSRCCSSPWSNSACWTASASRYGTRPSQRTRRGRLLFPVPSISELGGPVPGLDDLLDPLEEAGGVGAVEGAVVPAHRQVADRMDRDRFGSVGSVGHYRLAHDGVGGDDPDLRLIDDRHRQHGARRPVVGDRERAAL